MCECYHQCVHLFLFNLLFCCFVWFGFEKVDIEGGTKYQSFIHLHFTGPTVTNKGNANRFSVLTNGIERFASIFQVQNVSMAADSIRNKRHKLEFSCRFHCSHARDLGLRAFCSEWNQFPATNRSIAAFVKHHFLFLEIKSTQIVCIVVQTFRKKTSILLVCDCILRFFT